MKDNLYFKRYRSNMQDYITIGLNTITDVGEHIGHHAYTIPAETLFSIVERLKTSDGTPIIHTQDKE
jgi:hypothetical protein